MKINAGSTGALALVLAAAAAAPAGAQAPQHPLKHAPRPTTAAITPADAMTRVYVLADDSMMGRQAGTRGNVMGTDYIAREARRIGLEPAGDGGTFFQAIPLKRRGVDRAATLTVDGQRLSFGSDFLLLPTIPGAFSFGERLAASNLAVVYGGRLGESSLIAPAQAAGKLVVFAAPLGPDGRPRWQFFQSSPLAPYASAAGIAIASLDATPEGIQGFLSEPQSMTGEPEAAPAGTPPGLLLTTAAAERLFGAPISGLQPGAAGKAVTGTVAFTTVPSEFPARNVVGVLRGTDPTLRAQYVAIGSHNDHDGVAHQAVDHDSLRIFNQVLRPSGADQSPDSLTAEKGQRLRDMMAQVRARQPVRRDSIYNGADDDASGTAAMLEIAEHLAQNRPKRSVIFVWHTAEELGLLGSEWFTNHPTVPRDSIVAQLNIDMIGRGAPGDVAGGGPGYLQLVGSRRLSTQLGDLVEETNRTGRHGFTFDYSMDTNGHPANIYCRSDHYNYARFGIPVTFFTTGGHFDYHMLTDEPQYIDYDKLSSVSRLIADIATAVGNRPDRLVVDKPKPDPNGQCRQ
jgi:hypothetical protein